MRVSNSPQQGGVSLMPGPVLGAIGAHLDLEASIGGYKAESEAPSEITAALLLSR